jgi:hypothetical protein
MGYLFLGTGGAMVAAVCVLATSGSLAVAFLTYMLGGALLTLTAAALSLACAPIRASLAPLVRSHR